MDLVLSPSEFIALLNQTLEFAYPSVVIEGELSELRVSKNRWVYFNLKDDEGAVLRFFGTVYMLPGPLEDGLKVQVRCTPRHHLQYGFSLSVQSMQVSGEGSIRRAQELLMRKLESEGLFAPERKRTLPYPPKRIGVITSVGSAAEADFRKILAERWGGVDVQIANVLVQGESAPSQIIQAINWFNSESPLVDVLVIIRGGGSIDDLAAFSTESVTRAVATSRIPTLVAIGHEIDLSLAELAADVRASTPSNAAQLLVPDRRHVLSTLDQTRAMLAEKLGRPVRERRESLRSQTEHMYQVIERTLGDRKRSLEHYHEMLKVLNPSAVLKRGYALVRSGGKYVTSLSAVAVGDGVVIHFTDGEAGATISELRKNKGE